MVDSVAVLNPHPAIVTHTDNIFVLSMATEFLLFHQIPASWGLRNRQSYPRNTRDDFNYHIDGSLADFSLCCDFR